MLHELWYALRRLNAHRIHTAMVIAIFAVGTGAVLTVLRVANAVLLAPLPYADADRLVRISMHLPIVPNAEMPFADVGYRALELRTHSFAEMAGYRATGANMTVDDKPRRMLSGRTTGNFFELLGVHAQLGTVYAKGDEAAHKQPMIVLSERLWREAFHGDRGVIGRVVRVDGAPATIIGVVDDRMTFPSAAVDYWTQMDLDPVGTSPYQLGISALGRLKSGVSEAAANSDATEVMRQVVRENPGPHGTRDMDVSGFHTIMRPLRDDMVGGMRTTLFLLGGAVAFVLLLTCVNVATLELVRSSARRAEFAIRVALGAGRSRIVAGALMEAGIQSLIGGMLGLALSGVSINAMSVFLPDAFDTGSLTGHGLGLMAGALLLAMVCAAASAVFPIATAFRWDLQSHLRDRTGGASPRIAAIRRALIVIQVATACLLVEGAILMNVTLREAQRVRVGFNPEGVLTFRLSLPPETYRNRDEVAAAYRNAVDRLRAIGGVVQVGVAQTIPLYGEQQDGPLGVEGRVFKADGSDPHVDFRIASAGYFPAMGIRLARGVGFSEGDAYLDGTPVLVSETMAREVFGTTDPIGQRIRTGPFAPWMTITGVVTDVRNRSLTEPPKAEVYLPFAAPRSPMGVSRDMFVVMRTAGSADRLRADAERAIRSINPDLPIYDARSYTDIIRQSRTREDTITWLLTAFAVVALSLAVAGSYAMLMFTVVQRKREFALRQAVGAAPGDLVNLIGGEMSKLLGVGLLAGLVGTLLLSKVLASFLFRVTPLDPRVTIGTLLVLGTAGFTAAVLPARRAGQVDPTLTLRE